MHIRSAENAENIKNPYLPGRRYTEQRMVLQKRNKRIRSNLDSRVEKFKKRE